MIECEKQKFILKDEGEDEKVKGIYSLGEAVNDEFDWEGRDLDRGHVVTNLLLLSIQSIFGGISHGFLLAL